MALWRLGAVELVNGYRSGSFTPIDVLEATVTRIEAVNPRLNAIVTLNLDAAHVDARKSAARWRVGEAVGPLDGVPITIKDNIPVRGLPCVWGSRAYATHIPRKDESPVARLRAAGALILGKTNVPEFTLQGFTDNLVFGATGNPWNPDLTPGGSSGGAVAAVASGMGIGAICTDGGGSIRRPCAHTGLYGLKTSPGFVGRSDGLPTLLGDFETMGPVARSPRDLRLLLRAMAAADPSDRASLGFSEAQRAADPTPDRQRILVFDSSARPPVDSQIRSSVEGVATILRQMGHRVESGDVPFDVDALNAIWGLIGPVGLAWLVDTRNLDTSTLSPSLAPMIEVGRAASARQYVQLLAEVQAFRAALGKLYERYDLLLTPSVAALPWPKGKSHPDTIDGVATGPRGHAIFTPFANAGGLPGINIPTAPAANGLPIGCQLVGRFGADLELVAIAEAYEKMVGPCAWPNL